jgi:hypothetical protein
MRMFSVAINGGDPVSESTSVLHRRHNFWLLLPLNRNTVPLATELELQ